MIGLTANVNQMARWGSDAVLAPRDEASAYVDPTFFIAPGVTDPGAYQFVFSEGIENSASAVPEPPSGLLMLSGLVGMLGCFVRRT